jgi:ribonuclease HI
VLYHEGVGTRREELFRPCGSISNYEAEIEAIRIAIEAVWTRMDDGSAEEHDVVVFGPTDALSVLQAIDGMGEWPCA